MYTGSVTRYRGPMLVSLIHISRKVVDTLRWVFMMEKRRVRKLDLSGWSGEYVWGTVEKERHYLVEDVLSGPEARTDWTVVWEDEPYTWRTYPSYSFIWHDGHHTLLTK